MKAMIKLRFPVIGKALENFLKAFSQGIIKIPTARTFPFGTEIELNLALPQVPEAVVIHCRFLAQNADKKSVRAEAPDVMQINEILSRLASMEDYRKLLSRPDNMDIMLDPNELPGLSADAPVEEVIDLTEEHVEKKPAAEKKAPSKAAAETPIEELMPELEKPAPREKVSGAATAGPSVEELMPELEKPAAAEGPVRAAKEPLEKKEPERPKKVIMRERIRGGAEEAPAEAESPTAAVKESQAKTAEWSSGLATVEQLRSWLVLKEKQSERKFLKPAETRKIEKKDLPKDIDASTLGAASRFSQSLVKAMLRSGYYAPDHPGSADAKQGLFQEFAKAVGESDEFGFMVQHRPGMTSEIFIIGISEEPAPLKKVLGIGTFELFYPKYLEYFKRKWLISFTVKARIDESNFNNFINIMSDPSVDRGGASESGRLLTRLLVDAKITEISTLFEDDLIVLETNLPWRVEMAIQRLAKDLKVVPMFKGVGKKDMSRIKRQIVEDLLRPLRQPEFLKDILINAYLISQQVKEIEEEELEQAIIDGFPLAMTLPTCKHVFKEFDRLYKMTPAGEKEEAIIARRVEALKRILKKAAARVVAADLQGADQLLEDLFNHQILTFEELPVPVQEKINTRRMKEEFQKQPWYWLGKFAETKNKEDASLFLQFFAKILPGLIDEKDWQNLFLITNGLAHMPPGKLKFFAEAGAANPVETVWSDKGGLLVRSLLEQSGETRKGVEQILLLLGEVGLQAAYQTMLQLEDQSKRKLLVENLAQFGPAALELFRQILKDPAKPAGLQVLALEALGRAKDPADVELVKKYLKHSKPEMRLEALSGLVRMQGWEAMPAIAPAISDPEPAVVKRLLAALGNFASAHPEAGAKLYEIAFDEERGMEIRSQALREMGRSTTAPETREELQEKLLEIVQEGENFRKRLRRVFSGGQEGLEGLKLASLELLGKAGDHSALEQLEDLNPSGKELKSKLSEVLGHMRLRLKEKV